MYFSNRQEDSVPKWEVDSWKNIHTILFMSYLLTSVFTSPPPPPPLCLAKCQAPLKVNYGVFSFEPDPNIEMQGKIFVFLKRHFIQTNG